MVRHRGKGNKKGRVEVERKGREGEGHRGNRGPHRSVRRSMREVHPRSLVDMVREPKGIENVGARGEQMACDRVVGERGGEAVNTEEDTQRGPRGSGPPGGAHNSIPQDAKARRDLGRAVSQSSLNSGSMGRLSSMGSLDSVLRPASPFHQGPRLGDWIRGSRSESPVPLEDTEPCTAKRSPVSSLELINAEAGGIAAMSCTDGTPWYGRTFSRTSCHGSLELAMAEAGRIGVLEGCGGGEPQERKASSEGSFPRGPEDIHKSFAEELTRRLMGVGGTSISLSTPNALQLHLEITSGVFPRPHFASSASPGPHTNDLSAGFSQLDTGCLLAPHIPPHPIPPTQTPPFPSTASPSRAPHIFAPRIPFQSLPLLTPDGLRSPSLQLSTTITQGRPPRPPRRRVYVPLWQVESTTATRPWSRRASSSPGRNPGPSILSPLNLSIASDLNARSHSLLATSVLDVDTLNPSNSSPIASITPTVLHSDVPFMSSG